MNRHERRKQNALVRKARRKHACFERRVLKAAQTVAAAYLRERGLDEAAHQLQGLVTPQRVRGL